MIKLLRYLALIIVSAIAVMFIGAKPALAHHDGTTNRSCEHVYGGDSGSYNSMINAGGEQPIAPSWLKSLVRTSVYSRSECTVGFAWAEGSFSTAYLGAYVHDHNGYPGGGASNVTVTVTSWDPGFNFPGDRDANFDWIGAGESKAGSVPMSFNFGTLPVGTTTRCFYYTLDAWYGSDHRVNTGGKTCYQWVVNPPPEQKGSMIITMYGPNNNSRVFNPGYIWPGALWPGNDRFNMCMAFFGKIPNSCTGGHVQSPNVSLAPLTYNVYRDNNIDTDGWYINYVQRALGGPIVPNNGFGAYSFPVANGQQVYADVHLEKYASQCRNSTFSVDEPKPGEEFNATFNMHNPGGITNWSHGAGVRMKVFIPSQFEIVTPAAGAYDDPPEVGLEAFLGNKIHLQIFYPGSVLSGNTFSRTIRLRVKATAAPGSIAKFPRSMIFPADSPAANPFGSPHNPGCDSQIEIGRQSFFPWLQTKYGDVSAADFVSGQKYDQPGSRKANSGEKEATYLIMAATADRQFCSFNLYALGTAPKSKREQCSNGGYSEGQDFSKVQEALNNAWTQNGKGSLATCNPRYGTQNVSSTLKVGATLSLCPNGTIYQVAGNSNLSSLMVGQPNIGRATIWVKGNLTIDRNVIYNYTSYSRPEDIPNLAIYVQGEVIIKSLVTQLDAAIISTGKIKTCENNYVASATNCGLQLINHGYMFANGGFQFGRNFYNEASPNINPAEKFILTGQSIAFPPPGLDKASLGNNDLKITQEDNPRVK